MKRILLVVAIGVFTVWLFDRPIPRAAISEGAPSKMEKVTKPDSEWKEKLTPEQYRVARERGTERAFTGEYWNTKTDGVYHCVCCGLPLFDAREKFDSGCGWPSFWDAVIKDNVTLRPDDGHGMHRTEVVCSRCDAHLGHVFDDGPPPTHQRYCINSASVKLEKREDKPAEKK
jgi:peptide-methionine (R)-S-oxide reductase